jgi:hypothetical protein
MGGQAMAGRRLEIGKEFGGNNVFMSQCSSFKWSDALVKTVGTSLNEYVVEMLLDDDDGRSFVAAGIAYCSEDRSNGRKNVVFVASFTNWMEEITVIL